MNERNEKKLTVLLGIILIIIGVGMSICLFGFFASLLFVKSSSLINSLITITLFVHGPLLISAGIGIVMLQHWGRKLVISLAVISMISNIVQGIFSSDISFIALGISVLVDVFIIGYFLRLRVIKQFGEERGARP